MRIHADGVSSQIWRGGTNSTGCRYLEGIQFGNSGVLLCLAPKDAGHCACEVRQLLPQPHHFAYKIHVGRRLVIIVNMTRRRYRHMLRDTMILDLWLNRSGRKCHQHQYCGQVPKKQPLL